MLTLFAMLKGWRTTYECWPAKGKVWDPKHSGKTPVGWWTEEGYSRIEIDSMDDVSGIHSYLDNLTKEQYYKWRQSMRDSYKKRKQTERNLFLDFTKID